MAMSDTQRTTYPIWRSSMKTIELWPRLVFGPYSRNRFGNPVTVMPRWASAPSDHCSCEVAGRRAR